MPSIHELLMMVMTDPTARVVAGVTLFFIMHGLKLIPGVEEKLLTTPKRRLAANVVLSMGPAGLMLLDKSVDMKTVVVTAVECALMGMGIHAGQKVLRGEPVGADVSK